MRRCSLKSGTNSWKPGSRRSPPLKFGRQLRTRLSGYFRNLLNRDCFGCLAEESGRIAAAALLVIVEKSANLHVLTGRIGLVMNVYIRPEFRRYGLATEVPKLMIVDAKRLDLSNLGLSAMDQGTPVYRKFGFDAESSGGLFVMKLKL